MHPTFHVPEKAVVKPLIKKRAPVMSLEAKRRLRTKQFEAKVVAAQSDTQTPISNGQARNLMVSLIKKYFEELGIRVSIGAVELWARLLCAEIVRHLEAANIVKHRAGKQTLQFQDLQTVQQIKDVK